jgi:hypothetical protein
MRGAPTKPGAPRAPWGGFPLSELTVLVALALGAFGLANLGTTRGAWAIGGATTLGCLAGLEIAIREHLSGRRSRTMLLAGALGALVSGGAMLLALPPLVALVAALVAAGIAVPVLRRAFSRAARGENGGRYEE